jgi:hypothetical protein
MQWVIFVKTFYYDRCKLQWFLKYDFNQMWKGAFLKVIERRKLCTSLWPNLNPFWDQPDPIGPVFRSWGPTRPDSTRILGPKLGSTRKNGSGLAALLMSCSAALPGIYSGKNRCKNDSVQCVPMTTFSKSAHFYHRHWIIWSGIKKNLICRILLLVRPICYIEAVITIPGHIVQCL